MNLIHLSDLHWNGGSAQNKGFVDMVEHLCSNIVENALVIVSGDIVEGVSKAEWVSAKNLLARLSVAYGGRLVIVPGNHDTSNNKGITYDDNAADRTRFYINSLMQNFIGKNGMRVVRHQGMKFICLDSCIGNQDDWVAPLARGELGRQQLAALEVELQDIMPTFIIVHHKPFATDVFHTLEDKDQMLKILERRDHVKAGFFGHIHEWNIRDVNGIRWFESDNTTVSRRYRIIDSDTLEHTVNKF